MKQTRIVLLLVVSAFSATFLGQTSSASSAPQAQPTQLAPTIASMVDRQISRIEKQITEAAEAMPEDKFNFSPESLKIPGDDYKGVRSFALQVKHVAASNYALWSPLTGDKFPKDYIGGNGPESVKTKAEILKFLGDSFALGHKAAATLTVENMSTIRSTGNFRDFTWPHLASSTHSIITDRWLSICG